MYHNGTLNHASLEMYSLKSELRYKQIQFFFTEKEEAPDYTPGIRQSGNAKITFNDNDYFKKVSTDMKHFFFTCK